MSRTTRPRKSAPPPAPVDPVAEAAIQARLDADRIQYDAAKADIIGRWGPRERYIRTYATNLREMGDRALCLPVYQRGAVWTFAQATAFLDSFLMGDIMSAMLLVELDRPGARTFSVLDGQQRLIAMGVSIAAHDGSARIGTAPLISLTDLRWHAEPAPDRFTLASLMGANLFTRTLKLGARQQYVAGYLADKIRSADWPVAILDRDITPAAARRAFAAWNHPGAPIDPDALAALLARPEPADAA